MASKDPTRSKVTPSEIRVYEKLRAAGLSVYEAAGTIGRGKSWAYNYEKLRRVQAEVPPAGIGARGDAKPPNRNLQEACGLCIHMATGDQKGFWHIVETFGAEIIPHLAQVAWFLALQRANDINSVYPEETVTAEDVFEVISDIMDKHFAGESLDEVAGVPHKVPELDHERFREWLVVHQAGSA